LVYAGTKVTERVKYVIFLCMGLYSNHMSTPETKFSPLPQD
jgi:hypothetical protein